MAKRQRVALISLHFAEYAMLLATALSKQWDVLLILRADNAENELGAGWRERIESREIEVLSVGRSLTVIDVLSSAKALAGTVSRFQPDVIHCQEGYRDALMLALPFLPLTPRVLTIHDPEPHLGSDSKIVQFSRVSIFRRLIRRWPTIAITHGVYLADRLAEVCPWLQSRIRVIPHGPLGGRIPNKNRSPPTAKLLFFGRMEEYKGLRIFVEAVIMLKAKGLQATGVVAGAGPELARHRVSMEKAGCFEIHEGYITPDQVAEYFFAARAVIIPYIEGTQSGVAAMALGFGRPVIASDVGSISELVRDGENGMLVPPKDATALAKAMEAIVCSDTLYERFTGGARALREGSLGWPSIAIKTGALYTSLISSSGVK